VVAEGPPEAVAEQPASYTGRYLAALLGSVKAARGAAVREE
jgi:excinuclease UvrABC ATPase subunit